MTDLVRHGLPDSGNAVSVNLIGPPQHYDVLRAVMGLKSEIDAVDTVSLTSPNDFLRMPNQPCYDAGDVTITATELRNIGAMMYEVELNPDAEVTGSRPRIYSFVLSLQVTIDGVRIYKPSEGVVTVVKVDDDTDIPAPILGARGWRAQELILQRATRQMREKRINNSAK